VIKQIRHTGIVTDDLECSLRFYRDLLGFEVTVRNDESGDSLDNMLDLNAVAVTTVKMRTADGQTLELLRFQSHAKQRLPREICDIGISHVALTTDDLGADYARLLAAGVRFNAPPQLAADGRAKVTFCQAPEGTYIELVEVL